VLSAAGVATSLAQVYSVNAVGYININLPVGFAMIANQLNASPNNNLSTILPSLPAGTSVFKFNTTSGAYDSSISLGPGGGWLPDLALNPGEGAFIQVTAATTITLVGEVPQGSPLPPVAMPAGLSINSSQVPQSVGLSTIGFPASAGDTVFLFNRTTQAYESFVSIGTGFIPSDPTPGVGEAFFVSRAAAATWSRTFTVN
jgi:hypothetical protein